MEHLRVFVSHSLDLQAEVETLKKDLPRRFQLYDYKEERAGRADIEDRLRDEIVASHLFLGVLGAKYGSAYDAERSNVEWEYDVAHGRSDLEIMMFLKEVAASEVQPRQLAFRARIAPEQGLKKPWSALFRAPSELVFLVRESVDQWLTDEHVKRVRATPATKNLRAPRPRPTGRVLKLAVALALLVGWQALVQDVSSAARVGALALAVCTIVACGFALIPTRRLPR